MPIPFIEPSAPRYIYINPKSNTIHVLMPVMTGTLIGLDNTCKSAASLQEFFGKSRSIHQKAVLVELTTYKKALEFDISLITKDTEIKAKKQERLVQINYYIEAIKTVLKSKVLDVLSREFPEYPIPLQEVINSKESNLHSMLLRPKEMDSYLHSVNRVFSVNRKDESVLYKVLSDAFKAVEPESRLSASVLRLLKEQKTNDFKDIQRLLMEQATKQSGIKNLDFYHIDNKTPVTKAYIDEMMMFDDSAPPTAKDYIDGLLGVCAPKLLETLVESPFYTFKTTEELSIVTQFFLASTNIYCYCNAISSANFGEALDKSEELSEMVAKSVLSAQDGTSIEDALLHFVSQNSKSFGLTKELTPTDKALIKKKFTEQFMAVKESPHFDEFTLLDGTKPGPFITHQGGICLNFAEFAKKICPEVHSNYFKEVCSDFETLKGVVTHNNPSVHAEIEISIEVLLAKIKDEDQLQALLKKLPQNQRQEIITKLQIPKFLHLVARGQQDEAEQLLKAYPEAKFLLQAGEFTDYSGRTYNCTAYEKAYWDKDTHMCRMLEKYMDEGTKAELLKRCNAIEEDGLKYTQNGKEYCTKHFDFTPLIRALKEYNDACDDCSNEQSQDEMREAWKRVGLAQRDVPAHVIHEYCNSARSFDPTPEFNEDKLLRSVTFYNYKTARYESVFPLVISDTTGLGVDFALLRAYVLAAIAAIGRGHWAWQAGREGSIDLLAISHLDEVRTEELRHSLENLKPSKLEQELAL